MGEREVPGPSGHSDTSLSHSQHPAPSTPTPLSLHYCNPIVLNKLRRWAVSSPLYDTSSRNHDYFVARLGMVAFKPNGFQSPSRTSTYSCVELTMGSEVPASVNAEKVYISMIAPVAKCRLLTWICQIIATEWNPNTYVYLQYIIYYIMQYNYLVIIKHIYIYCQTQSRDLQ